MNKDEQFMLRAIDLAKSGFGHVSPNPMVGAVVVHEDKIIGEGWHQKYGGPHAEVNALADVFDRSLLPEATVYVTLEPCSHHGKTPPCADLLINENIKRVVIGTEDPNPVVAGSGIRKLREAGIEVTVGILDAECKAVNRRFFVNQILKRPYVILKWAQTKDGFIARQDGTSKWISSDESRRLVQKWRSEEDAILAGSNTVRIDDPALTVRSWQGRDPVRIIIDRNNVLPKHHKVFSDGGKTICYTRAYSHSEGSVQWIALGHEMNMEEVLKHMLRHNLGSVIVEGGSGILNAFLSEGLWDEARIFTSAVEFGNGVYAPALPTHTFREEIVYTDKLHWHLKTDKWLKI